MPPGEGSRNTICRCIHPTFLSPFSPVLAITICRATRMMDYSSIYSQLFGLSLGSLQMTLSRLHLPRLDLQAGTNCSASHVQDSLPALRSHPPYTDPPGGHYHHDRARRPATGTVSAYLMALINPAVFSAAFLSAVGSMMGKQPVQSAD